jgi:hypothetical protein
MFKPRDGGARGLRHKKFAELGLDTPTNFEGRFRLRDRHTTSDDLVTLDVASNDASVMELLRLHLYGLVEPLSKVDLGPPPSVAHRRVAMHLGAMPIQFSGGPSFLDDSIDTFRRANIVRHTDASATTMSTKTDFPAPVQMKGLPQINTKQERWSYGTLADGCIAIRTVDHPGLERMDTLNSEIEGGKLLRIKLDPLEKTPYIARVDDGSVWACFGGPKVPTTADVEASLLDMLLWSFGSAMLRELRGVWVRGAAVCDASTGAATLFVGPKRSGKASMALHCLAAHPSVQFLSGESSFVFVHPISQELMIASLPLSPALRLGTLMGTMQPNPMLQPPDISLATAAAHNSLDVIWNSMTQTHRTPIAESFGLDRCCSAACPLKAIVQLDWSTDQLDVSARREACAVSTHTNPLSLVSSLVDDGAFMSHPLMEWGSGSGGGDTAPQALAAMMDASSVPEVHQLGGDVAFAKGVRFVLERIYQKSPSSLEGHYQRPPPAVKAQA